MSSITHTTLLAGLKGLQNEQVWADFYARYHPLLIGVARRLGLSEEDAQDAAQETLLAFVDGYVRGQYDRSRGRLRTWLFGIAAHKIRDIRRRNQRIALTSGAGGGDDAIERLPDDRELGEIWEAEWRRVVMETCMEKVRKCMESTTVQAFELFVLREWPADRVSEHLGISRNAVFKAKRRVLTRLREACGFMEANW